jgi:copper(I)-binding protein
MSQASRLPQVRWRGALECDNMQLSRRDGRRMKGDFEMIRRRDLLAFGGSILGGAALGLFGARRAAQAHEYDVGALKIEHPWIRAPKDGETTAYFYAFLHNNGAAADKLIAVKSPNVGKVEFFSDAAGQTPAPGGIALPPKTKTTLSPSGAHVVLSDIKKHLEVGWGFEMVLVFEKAGEVTVDAAIDAPDAKHAHDAEAMERWEKAHGKDNSGAPPPSHEGHHHHEMKSDDGSSPNK